jgi:hypothetical protein
MKTGDYMKKIILAALVVATSGCGVLLPEVMIAGTAEGYRAYADGNSALITNAKTTDPLGDSASWQHRKQQEQEITKRRCAGCGFFQKLTGTTQSTEAKY